jgi:asparagine synthase (glutamine-hydrolysing)
MTAVAGIWDFQGRRNVEEDSARMLAAQSIYGVHGESRWSDGAIALGRRIWRSLPEDVHDTQPLHGGAGRFVLVADLRLDNRDELAGELGISRSQVGAMCDAALLLAAFERWDDDCCDRLIGDYAFAVWDGHAHRLVLARDFLGARPLHYHRGDGFFAFASMPKGLHALADIPRAPDEERVAEFLALMPEYGSRSFFQGIERVEPGQVVTVTRAGLRMRRHWNWQRRTLALRSADEYVEALRHHLDQAVQCRLRGTHERVAASLSAGLDSSAVATTAARLLAPTGGTVVAFTSVPRSGGSLVVAKHHIADEGPLAAATAAMYPNIEHVVVDGSDRSPLDTLERNFFLNDYPVLAPCAAVTGHAIGDAVRARKLPVLLTGGMGNMTISYNGEELLAELMAAGHWIKWVQNVAAIVRARHRRLRGALFATVAPWLPPALWQLLTRRFQGRSSDIRVYSAIHPRLLTHLDLASRARAHGLDFTYRPWKDGVAMRLWAMSRVDAGNFRKGSLAGWGIDVRDPTADRRVVEFCLSVPTEQFLRDGEPRALARGLLSGRVPPAVVNERRRGLAAADWYKGMTAARARIVEEIDRLENTAPAVRALDLARLRRLTENWPTQGWERREVIDPYRLALLRGIAVGDFLRRASGGNA